MPVHWHATVLGAGLLLLAASLSLSSSNSLAADRPTASPTPAAVPTSYACGFTSSPVLFATSVPIPESFGTKLDAFGNHKGSVQAAGRGGDLYIRYPDGKLRNLTHEAGYGIPLSNGDEDPANSIAVRDPASHWSGNKALFAMAVGAPAKIWDSSPQFYWQIYEVSGLCPGQTVQITKLPQPAQYNHIQPVYDSSDNILFTSDMPPTGPADRHLYPLLDEYEGNPITSGIWRLNRVTGQASLLNHTPSGAFNPSIDSAGRIIFSRWDHLKRNMNPVVDSTDSKAKPDICGDDQSAATVFDYQNESASALTACRGIYFDEVFPELQPNVLDRYIKVGTLSPDYKLHYSNNNFNHFFPWMMNQDGSNEETLNHVGRHELNGSYMDPSRPDDPNLNYNVTQYAASPATATLADIAGVHHLREDPRHAGTFFATVAHEIGARTAGQLVSINGGIKVNAADMKLTYLTPPSTRYPLSTGQTAAPDMSGLYRQPLPMSDGKLVVVHTPPVGWPNDVDHNYQGKPEAQSAWTLRLRYMSKQADGSYLPGKYLTAGITKSVSYWYGGDFKRTYSGVLWEMDPAELRVSAPPPLTMAAVKKTEVTLIANQGVDLAGLQSWLQQRKLALLVVRNATQRDHSDHQQPYNLQVTGTGGVSSIAPDCAVNPACKIYTLDTLQLFEARYLRSKSWSYDGSPTYGQGAGLGRRALPRPMESSGPISTVDPSVSNPAAVKGKLPGSLKVFPDGSVAGFIPAQRALSWQLVDSAQPGQPKFGTDGVVRERYWVTFQPGEVRTCASCHGVNKTDQMGRAEDNHQSQALKALMKEWKKMTGTP